MGKITIFGLAGTGTSSTGKALSKMLDIPFMSAGNMWRKEAEKLSMSLIDFHLLAEKDDTYDKRLDALVQSYGKEHADFVFESRLPWYFIPDSLKVKLTCEYEQRLRRVARRDGLSLEETKRQTELREKIEMRKYHALYGIEDYTDDSHFDMILDTTSTPLHVIVERIAARAGGKESGR